MSGTDCDHAKGFSFLRPEIGNREMSPKPCVLGNSDYFPILRLTFSYFQGKATTNIQRAEKGALDPRSLDLRLGRRRFFPQIAPKPFKTSLLGPLDCRGTPNTQIQRPRIQRPILGPLKYFSWASIYGSLFWASSGAT